jgi:hypothetical protein
VVWPAAADDPSRSALAAFCYAPAVAQAIGAASPRAPRAWLWGARVDGLVWGGAPAAAPAGGAAAPWLAPGGVVPGWAWLALVVAVDVAHVHSTLFRTYLDPAELRRRPALYAGLPVACFAVGAALHLHGERTFWRVLAYVAVFHFVRQQVGWVAIYRALAGERSRLGRVLDDAVVYAAAGFPLLYWHAHLPRAFRWFVEGDFASASWLPPLVAPAGVIYAAIAAAYVARALLDARRGAAVPWGKHLVVATTAATWLVGIVLLDDDFAFTATNVLVHGVPYMALLWFYAKARAPEVPRSPLARVVSAGVLAFLAVCFVVALAEEVAWDRLVWLDRPLRLGGGLTDDEPLLGPTARAIVVPLLAVPQATHYVLDAVLWRRRDTGPAQAKALGFG